MSKLSFVTALHDVSSNSIDYSVKDTANETSQTAATLTLNIIPDNDLPTATDSSLSIDEDTLYTFKASDFGFDDVDGHTFTSLIFKGFTGQGDLLFSNGTLGVNTSISVNDLGLLTYQTLLHETENSQFDFVVVDSSGEESAALNTLTLSIQSTVDEPTAADNTLTLLEDGQRSFTAADFNFADVDTGDTLKSVQIITDVSVGELELNGQAVNAGDSIAFADLADLTYVAQDDDMGGSSFTFRVTDNTDLSSLADYTMTLAITPQSDPPTASGTLISVTEDVVHQFSTSEFGFDDVDNDTFAKLVIVSTSGQGSYEFNGAPITIGAQGQEIPASDMANLRYLPASHDVSGGSFEYKVVDSADEESQQYTMTMQIDAEPDRPTTSDTTVNVTEDILHQFCSRRFCV